MTSHHHVPAAPGRPGRETARHAAARQTRDDGLRRVRKITWRIGLVSAAAAAFIGAKFAHLAPSLPHLSGSLTGGSAGTGAGTGVPATGPASGGVSAGSGGGVAISGGS